MAKCVKINQDECVGCETCVEICPDVFAFDESIGKARIIKPDGVDECIQEAMDSCPVECIQWEEE